MTAGQERVSATFWLLGAPDSLFQQSVSNPDGTGLGTFDEQGRAIQERQALEAAEDWQFVQESRERRSSTFAGHVRRGTGGGIKVANCHPFLIRDRFFAHNGVIRDVATLEAHLGAEMDRVQGETDSERYAVLVDLEIRKARGDVSAGILAAASWISTHLPVFSLNLVVTSAHELWALRQGDSHPLLFLDRRNPAGKVLNHRGSPGTTTVHSEHLSHKPAVVVATEAMDADPGWTPLAPGELLHVNPNLRLAHHGELPPPARQLNLNQLDSATRCAQV